jgi:4-hydroxyphenylpyruvate dioxygenase-like putative hemolysin
MDGIEFIEFATSKPQLLGALLESMGFCQVARHRSREVTLFRQGSMNLVVNAQPMDLRRIGRPVSQTSISAFAIRVGDAQAAIDRATELGAWAAPARARAMELNIPAMHGVGDSLVYFVDRHDEFSIYGVDFRPIPGVDPYPPAVGGLGYFGVVQYIGIGRGADWIEFYQRIFGFVPVPDSVRFGIMPKGVLLRSPCGKFWLQLVEPEGAAAFAASDEHLNRVGLGTADVIGAVKALEKRGIEFIASSVVHSSERGALTVPAAGGVIFELVHATASGAGNPPFPPAPA